MSVFDDHINAIGNAQTPGQQQIEILRFAAYFMDIVGNSLSGALTMVKRNVRNSGISTDQVEALQAQTADIPQTFSDAHREKAAMLRERLNLLESGTIPDIRGILQLPPLAVASRPGGPHLPPFTPPAPW